MSLFQQALEGADSLKSEFLGETYPYWSQIKKPEDIGMSDRGDLATLASDIGGLISYTEVLVTGQSEASATGGPLGNKFFLKTGGMCIDQSTKQKVSRSIYVDNVPDGNIPFISSGMGQNFSSAKGLIPGTMSNMNRLNPSGLMSAFMAGSEPDCKQVTLEVRKKGNNWSPSSESAYVTLIDIANQKLEGFANIEKESSIKLPDDPIVQIYFASLGMLGIYVLYCIMKKRATR